METLTPEVIWAHYTLSLSALIMTTVNSKAFGRKGYECWRRCANGKSATVQTAASAVLAQTALVPKGKVTAAHF